MKYKNILDNIGNTPIIKIQKLSPNPKVNIYAKLEGNNPSGSVKDRIARYIIEKAERDGLLKKGKILLEATSGNTGISLAMIATLKGYKFIAVMPEDVGDERIKLLKIYGADVILTSAEKGMNGAVKVAKNILERNKKYIMLDQFNNSANILAHYETTAEEIIQDLPKIDFFVAGMGTGGTLMGVGKKLKQFNSEIKIIGVEPLEIKSKIQGLRNMKTYTPSIFDKSKLDEIIKIVNKDAYFTSKALFTKEGISAGVSSGAAMWAAIQTAKKLKKGNILVLFPDKGDKYFGTKLFN